MKRKSFQHGSVVRTKRSKGPDKWVLRYRDVNGVQKAEPLGDVIELPNKTAAEKKAAMFRLSINERQPCVTVGELCARYELEGMPERESTAAAYKSFLGRIRSKWSKTRLDEFVRDVSSIEMWLKDLKKLNPKTKLPTEFDLSKSSKAHIKAFLHRMIECAMRWSLLPVQRNPVALVEITGSNKRVRPLVLIPISKFWALVDELKDCPHVRFMVHIAMFLGLRGSEMLGLRPAEDFDFEALTVHIQRSSVGKNQDDPKTEASDEILPLHPELAELIQAWMKARPVVNGWLLGNPLTGRPYHLDSLLKDHLQPAGLRVGLKGIGWHSFRHTYRAMLRDMDGVPLEVQQSLMRHADIRTTTKYGGSMALDQMRPANTKVVEMMRRKKA